MDKHEVECIARDNAMCKWLNKKSCSECYMATFKQDEQEKAYEHWKITQSLLPDGIDELHLGEDCRFCKKTPPNTKACYAIIDMAHKEPISKKPMFFGIGKKVQSPIGSLMPVSVSCCSDCRNVFRNYDLIRWFIVIGFVILGLGLVMLPGVSQMLSGLGELIPFVALVVSIIIGVLLSALVSNRYIKNKSETVHINIFEIPMLAKMGEMGWFIPQSQQENASMSRLIFSKHKSGAFPRLKVDNIE